MCDSAIANAAEMKEGHDFVSPPKRKWKGFLLEILAKSCVYQWPRLLGAAHPIDQREHIYSSQSSGIHAAIRQAAAAPALVLDACPPHLIKI